MSRLLAIDPGPTESAIVFYNPDGKRPAWWEKVPNVEILDHLDFARDRTLAIETLACYGMAVGAETFETAYWIGRFIEHWAYTGVEPRRVLRRDVKLHICGDTRAKDANVRQALIDRYGGKAKAVGLKATPGPLYGMTGDCWAALAVAITAAETESV
jgi:hypothetical protein